MSERLEGINSVLEALRSGRRKITTVYYVQGKSADGLKTIMGLAQKRGVPVKELARPEFDRMSRSDSPQGVLAEASAYPYFEIDDLLGDAAQKQESPFIIVLDGIEDPQNLGAVMRTAEVLGVHGVIVPKHNACDVTPAVVRASAGAAEHIKVVQVTNLVQALKYLKDRGVWIVGSDAAAQQSCFELDYPESLALVIGGEGRGIRRLVLENCDFKVKIPMKGRVSSLNASVSAAIVMAQAVRQRAQKAP
ncbi:MAG: 23S rRNA (guanosine(2251)-2'-O)-methyltransferase RlmB [Candidatus Saccharibacteria bacterium]